MRSILCLFLLMSSSAFASDLTGKFGVGANVGFPIPSFGNAFNDVADPEYSVGIHGRYNFTSHWGIEVGYSRMEFKHSSMKFDNGNVLALYRTAGSNDFTYVVGAGLAATKIKNFSPSNIKLSGLLRAGIEANLTSNLVLGAHVDYQYVSKILGDMPGSRAHVISPVVGVTWYFGASDVKTFVTKAKEEIKEMTAANTDSDKDGVMDSEDKCPNTKPNTKVNGFGCALEEKAEIRVNVEFLPGKSNIRSEYNAQMQELADFMNKYPDLKVEVQGHTDTSGSLALNTKLSQDRANSVMKALVNLGIAKDRLTAKGYGPTQPIADNSTAEGKQKNRRVVVLVK